MNENDIIRHEILISTKSQSIPRTIAHDTRTIFDDDRWAINPLPILFLFTIYLLTLHSDCINMYGDKYEWRLAPDTQSIRRTYATGYINRKLPVIMSLLFVNETYFVLTLTPPRSRVFVYYLYIKSKLGFVLFYSDGGHVTSGDVSVRISSGDNAVRIIKYWWMDGRTVMEHVRTDMHLTSFYLKIITTKLIYERVRWCGAGTKRIENRIHHYNILVFEGLNLENCIVVHL